MINSAKVTSRTGLLRTLVAFALLGGCTGFSGAYRDPDDAFAQAIRLGQQKEHEKAADSFATFAKRFEHDERADMAIYISAGEWFAAGQFQAAAETLDILFQNYQQSPYLARANRMALDLGKALLEAKRERGVDIIEHALARGPYGEPAAQAHIALAQYYNGLGQYGKSVIELDAAAKALPSDSTRIEAEIQAADAELAMVKRPARNDDRLASARKRLLQLKNSPALTLEQAERAVRTLKKIDELYAERGMALAEFYLKQGESDSARAELASVAEHWPQSQHAVHAKELISIIDGPSPKTSGTQQ